MTGPNQHGCIGIIARMGSTRLPNKHIIDVNGNPIIFYLINRNTIITFKDIRDVNNIVNILLIQMDYEYLGKEEGKMKFYYDGLEEDWTK